MLDVDVVLVSLHPNAGTRTESGMLFHSYHEPTAAARGGKRELRSSEMFYQSLHLEHGRKHDGLLIELSDEKVRKRLAAVESLLQDESCAPQSVYAERHGKKTIVTMVLGNFSVVTLSFQAFPFGLADVSLSNTLQRHNSLLKYSDFAAGLVLDISATEDKCLIASGDAEQPIALAFGRHKKLRRSLAETKHTKEIVVSHGTFPELGVAEVAVWNCDQDIIACVHYSSRRISVLRVDMNGIAPEPLGIFDTSICEYETNSPSVTTQIIWSKKNKHLFFVVAADSATGEIFVDAFVFSYGASPKERISRRAIMPQDREGERLLCESPLLSFSADPQDATLALGFADGTLVAISTADGPPKWRSTRLEPSAIHAICWHPSADLLCVCLATQLFVLDRALTPIRLALESSHGTSALKLQDCVSLGDFVPTRSTIVRGGCAWLQMDAADGAEMLRPDDDSVHALCVVFSRGPVALVRVRVASACSQTFAASRLGTDLAHASNVFLAREHLRQSDPGDSTIASGSKISTCQAIDAALALIEAILQSNSSIKKAVSDAVSIYAFVASRLIADGDTDLLGRALYDHPIASSFSDQAEISAEVCNQFARLTRSCLGACIRARNFVLAFRFADRVAKQNPAIAWRVFSMLTQSSAAAGEAAVASVCSRYEKLHRPAREPVPNWNAGIVGGDQIILYLNELESLEQAGEGDTLSLEDALRLGMWWEARGDFLRAAGLYAARGLYADAKRARRSNLVITQGNER